MIWIKFQMDIAVILGVLFAIGITESQVVRRVTIDRSAFGDGVNFPDGYRNQLKADDGRVFQGDYLMLGHSRKIKFVQYPIPQTSSDQANQRKEQQSTRLTAVEGLEGFKASPMPNALLTTPVTKETRKVYRASGGIGQIVVLQSVPKRKAILAEKALTDIRQVNAVASVRKNVMGIVTNSTSALNLEVYVKRTVTSAARRVKQVIGASKAGNATTETMGDRKA